MSDLRYALRQIARRPGVTAAAAVTLALGIGANTAIFSAIEAAILRPPAYPASDQLRIVHTVLRRPNGAVDTMGSWSYPMFDAFRRVASDLGSLAAYTPAPLEYNLETAGDPERAQVEVVSAGYFSVLGVHPAFGRFFVAEEDQVPGEAAVVVLSHDAWTRLYGADSSVVGRTIRLNTIPLTVIGVASPGFRGLSDLADAWTPMMMAPSLMFARRLSGEYSFWHAVVARIPGAPEPGALGPRLTAKARLVESEIPVANVFGGATLDLVAVPLAQARVNPATRTILRVLMGAVAFVLLIVCVNVANLLLTQAARRRHELGVRVALGAGGRHLARIFLIESVVLGLLGGIGGLLVALWGMDLLGALAPPVPVGTADPGAGSIGLSVLLFNFGIAALAGFLVGLPPALRVIAWGAHTALQESPRHQGGARSRGVLIAAEIALALVLLTGAALMLRSLGHLRGIDPGFQAAGLLTAVIPLPRQAYDEPRVIGFLDAARERVAATPGVDAVTVANCLPLAGGCDFVGMEIRSRPGRPDQQSPSVSMNMVDGEYFRTLGIPLVAGRTFEPGDRGGAPRVAIVSRAVAERNWPGESPLGARIRLSVGWEEDAEVVGVVGDVPDATLDAPPQPLVYLPYQQWTYHTNYLVLRAGRDLGPLATPVRRIVNDLDPGVPVWDLRTMQERVGQSFAETRFTTTLLTLAAALATLLAALGVFGVMAFAVASRTREFGLRMALGARAGDVLRLVLRQGMQAAAVGLAAGLAGAFFLTRFLATELHGVSARDPLAFAAGATFLALVALAAAWLPARRATHVDPMEALRHE